ncbi:MAG: hypothetical protein QOE95_2366 [Gaiellaceae bacterium]|jgi:uncharacterized protein (TIGR00369 family)|nr:hypothetical protein [Gaiellaceae bacterium]
MAIREPDPPNPDFAETTARFLMEMPIAKHLGFSVTGIGPGLFEITQPFREELSFRAGVFQAGPVGTLADMAAACAGMTMLPRGWAASTVDYTIKLFAPAAGEAIVARGRVVGLGRTLSVTAAEVYAVRGGKETLCATALTTIRNFETSRL